MIRLQIIDIKEDQGRCLPIIPITNSTHNDRRCNPTYGHNIVFVLYHQYVNKLTGIRPVATRHKSFIPTYKQTSLQVYRHTREDPG